MSYHLQNASRAFQADRWILRDKNVSIALRLKFVDAGSFAWVSHPHRTTVGMQWIQAMATEICGGTLEIWKLCRFVARTQQVDQTCACPAPAPAAKETWTNMSL